MGNIWLQMKMIHKRKIMRGRRNSADFDFFQPKVTQGCSFLLQVVLQSEEDSEHYTLRSLEVAFPILQDLYFGLRIFVAPTSSFKYLTIGSSELYGVIF